MIRRIYRCVDGGRKMVFLGTLLKYVVGMIVFGIMAALGIFTGKKLRDRKDAKNAAYVTEETNVK